MNGCWAVGLRAASGLGFGHARLATPHGRHNSTRQARPARTGSTSHARHRRKHANQECTYAHTRMDKPKNGLCRGTRPMTFSERTSTYENSGSDTYLLASQALRPAHTHTHTHREQYPRSQAEQSTCLLGHAAGGRKASGCIQEH